MNLLSPFLLPLPVLSLDYPVINSHVFFLLSFFSCDGPSIIVCLLLISSMASPLHTGDMQVRKPAKHTSRLSHHFREKEKHHGEQKQWKRGKERRVKRKRNFRQRRRRDVEKEKKC